jgi:phosphoribosyl-AMP cyclohydrolase
MQIPNEVKFDADGLIPAVIQDSKTNQVLMLGFMNRAALEQTLNEGKVCFYSRSRKKHWLKGETSGNFLMVKGVFVNCDTNSLLVTADPVGPTCHEGYDSCYFRQITDEGLQVIAEQKFDPKDVYKK